MKEACGVFGVYAPGRDVAQLTFDGIYALQHRGQESAGMAVSDGETITVVKDMGLVPTVFDERTLSALPGYLAIGHTRYSTHGSSDWSNAQPVYRPVGRAGFALGHNGNLTNTDALAERAGMLPGLGVTDSDVVAELIATAFPAADGGTPTHGELGPAIARVAARVVGRLLASCSWTPRTSTGCGTPTGSARCASAVSVRPRTRRAGCSPRSPRPSTSSGRPSSARSSRARW